MEREQKKRNGGTQSLILSSEVTNEAHVGHSGNDGLEIVLPV